MMLYRSFTSCYPGPAQGFWGPLNKNSVAGPQFFLLVCLLGRASPAVTTEILYNYTLLILDYQVYWLNHLSCYFRWKHQLKTFLPTLTPARNHHNKRSGWYRGQRSQDSPLSPSLAILRRSMKCVPKATSFTLSESRIWTFMRLHRGGNISVKTICSFQIGS